MKYTFLLVLAFVLGKSQTAPVYNFPKIQSSITMPVSVPIAEMNRLVNNSIKGVLYNDESFTDNNNDQLKTKVEKDGDIVIKGLTNQRLMFSVPLKIWASKGYGTLGVYAYQSTNFRVVMNFISQIGFNPDWSVNTKTTTAGFVWKEKPVLDYGRVKIPIATLIEGVLNKQQRDFTSVIDTQIKTKLNLQPYLVMAWNQFAKPINVSEQYNTWLKITPQGLKMSPLEVYADKLKANIGIDLFSETFVGSIPPASPTYTSVPNFQPANTLNKDFNLQTTANIPFTEATAIAQKQFLGKEFTFREGKSKVKVEDIKVYADGQDVVIEVQTSGTVEGTSFIKGVPKYDEVNHKVVFSKTDFRLKTKNFFQKVVAMLFEGKVVKMIETEYGIPLQDIESSSKKSIEESFNKEYYKGLKLQGKVISLKPSSFIVSDQVITAVIDTHANVELTISGLNF